MREDFAEKLEEMFPKGYVILYPTDDRNTIRMRYLILDDQRRASDQMNKAVTLIEECSKG